MTDGINNITPNTKIDNIAPSQPTNTNQLSQAATADVCAKLSEVGPVIPNLDNREWFNCLSNSSGETLDRLNALLASKPEQTEVKDLMLRREELLKKVGDGMPSAEDVKEMGRIAKEAAYLHIREMSKRI